MMFKRFFQARSGATMVEMGLLAPIVMTILVAMIGLSVFMWQWNSLQRTVRNGARLASMSAPVAGQLVSLANSSPGTSVGSYSVSCDGSTKTCSDGSYDSAAMTRILTGGDGLCSSQTQVHLRGLCDMIPGLTESNIFIEYTSSAKEVGGAPGGLQPIITLQLKNVSLGYNPFSAFGVSMTSLPTASATVLAQDLSEGSFD